jgi:hypothetical protein
MKRCEQMAALVSSKKAQRARERRCFWTWPFGHCGHRYNTGRTVFGLPWAEMWCCRCGSPNASAPEGAPVECAARGEEGR